jgi:hypothetical protein
VIPKPVCRVGVGRLLFDKSQCNRDTVGIEQRRMYRTTADRVADTVKQVSAIRRPLPGLRPTIEQCLDIGHTFVDRAFPQLLEYFVYRIEG